MVVARMDANEELTKRLLDDADFQASVADFYLRKVYARLNEE
jgi:hypothetical protein